MTLVNADTAQRVVIDTTALPWSPTDRDGLEEKVLERDDGPGGGRCSRLLRCRAGLIFPQHRHAAGEEYLVLEGAIADEFGTYPTGTYVRNPPGSSHESVTEPGCVLFHKTGHMRPEDGERVVIATDAAEWLRGMRDGTSVIPLFRLGAESVALFRWDAESGFYPHRHIGGEEIFVLAGTLEDEHGVYPSGTWLRNPSHSTHQPRSKEGCLFYIKSGHLGLGRPAPR